MATTDLYDPRPGESYARCEDCSVVLADPEAVRTHMAETMAASTDAGSALRAQSHSVRTLNPTRPQRIARAVERILQDAVFQELGPDDLDLEIGSFELKDHIIQGGLCDLDDMINHDHATVEEVDAALERKLEFRRMWREQHDLPELDQPKLPIFG